MKPKELDKIRQIEKAESELGTAVTVFTWILGIALGVIIGISLFI